MEAVEQSRLGNLIPAADWREAHASHVFTSKTSWRWFRRTHSDELVERGVLIPGRGPRSDYVDIEKADTVIPEIIKRVAREDVA
jgi:hypothetical protein